MLSLKVAQANFIATINDGPDALDPSLFDGPIDLRFPVSNRDLPPAGQWSREHKNGGRARSFVFVIDSLGVFGRARNGRAGFLQQLNRLLVHAKHGNGWIVRHFVGF